MTNFGTFYSFLSGLAIRSEEAVPPQTSGVIPTQYVLYMGSPITLMSPAVHYDPFSPSLQFESKLSGEQQYP